MSYLGNSLGNQAAIGTIQAQPAGNNVPSWGGLTSSTPYIAYPHAPGPSPYEVRKDALTLCIQLMGVAVNNVEQVVGQAKRLERFLLTGE